MSKQNKRLKEQPNNERCLPVVAMGVPPKTESEEQEPKKQQKTYEMTPAMLKSIVKMSSEAAVKAYQRARNEELGKSKDNRLRNTKLLMENYRKFKVYCNEAIYDTAQLCQVENEQILELMGINAGKTLQVGSIRNSVVVTKVIMEHVDTMLRCYRAKCMQSKKQEVQRRWEVLSLMYLSSAEPMNAQEVADKVHVGKSTVYNDIDYACAELSSLIFGLDLSEYLV